MNVHDALPISCTFMHVSRHTIPSNKKITHAKFVCDIKLFKTETHRVHLTVGGDKLTYNVYPRSPSISLLDLKIHLNSVISDARKGARYLTADIINYYLRNPMENYQYMRIPLKEIPNEVLVEYSLLSLADPSGYVFVKIRKGLYGLKESSIISYKRLIRNLQPHGYAPVSHTPGLWTHTTLPTTLTLAVDNSGINLFATDDATHLLDMLRKNYSLTVNPSGSKYCGLTINWSYPGNYVNISMPNVICKALEIFQHATTTHPQHSPHKRLVQAYGSKVQCSPNASTAPALDKRGITCVQSISGTFLYIVHAVDPTVIVTLNDIGDEQASTPTDTIHKTKMLMDYAATKPDAVIRFHASDTCLHIDSDFAYLIQPKSRRCAAGHFYLSDNPPSENTRPTPSPNGPVLTKC